MILSRFFQKASTKLFTAGLLSLALLLTLVLSTLEQWLPKAWASGNSLSITMKDMGNEEGYTLKTVRNQRDYYFSKPRGWAISPSSRVHLVYQHSPHLLKERSSLNVMVNGRILKTIELGPENVKTTIDDIAIPPKLLKDRNILSFQVDQHYTYDCEDPLHASLWTTIVGDTSMTLDYQTLPSKPDLAQFPYPLQDELNSYQPTKIGFAVPSGLSDASLEALAKTTVHLGQQNGWPEYTPFVAQGSEGENLVLVGTPDENPAISAVSSGFDVKLSGGKFQGGDGSALPEDTGVIQFIPNPYASDKAILVVSGNSPKGVLKAAQALSQNPSNRVLVGRSTIVKDFVSGPEHPYRAWDSFIQKSGDNFDRLGLQTQTARGWASAPLVYKVKKLPDVFLPGGSKVKLHTYFSYASQLLSDQSKLEVRLNGKAVKSINLDNERGETNKEFVTEINAEDFHTFNDLEYQFFIYPVKEGSCRFVTDAHVWGTVHNTTYVELPGELKTPIPDVGLMNDAGFPFTGFQDFTQVAVAIPKEASAGDKNAMIQLLTRLGRESFSRRGMNIKAFHADSVPGDVRGSSHMIVIGNPKSNPLLKEMNSKARFVLEGNTGTLKTPDGKLLDIQHNPDQGLVEEMISPWNDKRVALAVTGENDEAMNRIGYLMMNDAWFGKIGEGNLTVVNGDGPKSAIVLTKGEARFVKPSDMASGFSMPSWLYIVAGFFAVLGVISVLRFLFGR